MRRYQTLLLVLALATLHAVLMFWRFPFGLAHAAHAAPAAIAAPRFVARELTSAEQGYVEPAFEARMHALRATILAAAARHNRPALSGMSDAEFAEALAQLLYNEHNGWFEDQMPVVRGITPFYQQMQQSANETGLGGDFSVWPSNIRPSVAWEILSHTIPLPARKGALEVPLRVAGSKIDLGNHRSQRELFAAITAELGDETLAVEYLAANLERGVYRARYEGAPITWQTLAAWHNGGVTLPADIAASPRTSSYIERAALYRDSARELIESGERGR